MKLDISGLNLVRLEVIGLTLRCYDTNGNVRDRSLEGITELWCFYNYLQSLPVLPNGLEKLHCNNNHLQSLPVLPETLNSLHCSDNQLQSLPTLPNDLKSLSCFDNQLQTLPTLPNGLEKLHCNNNHLQSLPVLPETLKRLYCFNNELRVLPILPNSLKRLFCFRNQLQSISSLFDLKKLSCNHNPLVFIKPMTTRPKHYLVPENLKLLHSIENYPKYQQRYQTYFYLITYLAFHPVTPVILSNEAWWFPGAV